MLALCGGVQCSLAAGAHADLRSEEREPALRRNLTQAFRVRSIFSELLEPLLSRRLSVFLRDVEFHSA